MGSAPSFGQVDPMLRGSAPAPEFGQVDTMLGGSGSRVFSGREILFFVSKAIFSVRKIAFLVSTVFFPVEE